MPFKHPKYKTGTAVHDIALVELATSVPDFDQFRSPICLPESPPKISQDDCCLISGWGKTGKNEVELEKFISLDTEYKLAHRNYTPFYTTETHLYPNTSRTTYNIIENDQNCIQQYGEEFRYVNKYVNKSVN